MQISIDPIVITMQREKASRTEYAPVEAVPVQMVDLGQYDKLYTREAVR